MSDKVLVTEEPTYVVVESSGETLMVPDRIVEVVSVGIQGPPGAAGADPATSSTRGVIKLAGDLGGTADAPTVPGLSGKEPTVSAGTTSQYYRGDKSWQTLNQDAVPDGSTNKAYSAADKTRLANTSGTNTGDQDLTGLVPKTTTVNGHALSSNVTVTESDIPNLSTDLAAKLSKSANLSDVPTPATARTNLGLGTAATQNKVAAGQSGVLDATDASTTNSRTPTGSAGGDLTGTYPNPTLATSGVTAATYGSATEVAQVSIDAKGRATGASNVAIQIAESQVTNLSTDLAGKEPTISAGSTSQYWRGDKSFQTLDKAAVGLGNVDNTSDATKNAATATLTHKTISGADNTLSDIDVASIDAIGTPSSSTYLRGDGSWSTPAGGGGGGSPGGSDTEVQFNDAGSFGGDAGLTYDRSTSSLTVSGSISAPNLLTQEMALAYAVAL